MSPLVGRPPWRGGFALTLLTAAFVVQAQGVSSRTQRPDPLDPQARVPSVTYQSPLTDYRRLGDDTRASWREANDEVNRIGGWRAYAREAQQPDGDVPAKKERGTVVPSSGNGHRAH